MPAPDCASRVDLAASPSAVRLPPVCAACGQPATTTVESATAFERWTDDGEAPPVFSHWEVWRLRLPVCVGCRARHETEVRPVPAATRLASMLRTWYVIGMAGGAAFSLFFARLASESLFRRDVRDAAIPAAVALVFLAIAAAHVALAWRRRRGEWVSPPTSVTAALQLGDDSSRPFEPRHHAFVCRNRTFAEALLAANADRVWDPDGPIARRAGRRRAALAIALVAVVALLFAISLLVGTGR